MARQMPSNQRVVRSIKDRSGNVYTKTNSGGKARAASAIKYLDQKEEKQLYRYDQQNGIQETDRYEAAQQVEFTDTKYQQHLAFTTLIPGDTPMLAHHERQTAEDLARAIVDRRPDAEIHAIAVHQQGENGNIHVHVVFGTDTTLRHNDLPHFREVSYQMEKNMQERLSVLQIDRKVNLRGEVNIQGVRETKMQDDTEGSKSKHSGKEPELDLSDLKHPPKWFLQQQAEIGSKKEKEQDRGYEWGR